MGLGEWIKQMVSEEISVSSLATSDGNGVFDIFFPDYGKFENWSIKSWFCYIFSISLWQNYLYSTFTLLTYKPRSKLKQENDEKISRESESLLSFNPPRENSFPKLCTTKTGKNDEKNEDPLVRTAKLETSIKWISTASWNLIAMEWHARFRSSFYCYNLFFFVKYLANCLRPHFSQPLSVTHATLSNFFDQLTDSLLFNTVHKSFQSSARKGLDTFL